jgi:hypothetical protein
VAGTESSHVNATTSEEVPSAPPNDVQIKVGVFGMIVTWRPVDCSHQNGKITGYTIQYYIQGNEERNDEMVLKNRTNFTITELQPSTPYIIRVAAVNSAGTGVYSIDTPMTMPFHAEVYSESPTSINLTWPQDHFAMRNIEILWQRNESCLPETNTQKNTTVMITEVPFVIPDLEEYSRYNITVCVQGLLHCYFVTGITDE